MALNLHSITSGSISAMSDLENGNIDDTGGGADEQEGDADGHDEEAGDEENAIISRSTLAYCWRAMKEVSLIYATLILRAPTGAATDATGSFVTQLGTRLKDLVILCRHKGSVELLGTAFETACRWCVCKGGAMAWFCV